MRGRWFAGWIVVGGLLAFTVMTGPSIGIFVLPFFGLAFADVVRHTRYPLDVFGSLVGIGAVLLAVAYSNEDHQPCASGSFSCGGLDPHPWLVVAWAFVTAGFGAYAALRLASRTRLCRRSTS